MSKKEIPEDCQHEEYCSFNKTLCETTDFSEKCRLKNTDIEDLKLLKKVKERVERDKERDASGR